MRRKTFDVLFSTRDGMEMLVKQPCLWRSLWYFTMSVGLFCGVITNQLFLEQPLTVRFGIIAVILVISGVCLSMYDGRAGWRRSRFNLPFGLYNPSVFNADAGGAVGNKNVMERHLPFGGRNTCGAAVDDVPFGAVAAIGIFN